MTTGQDDSAVARTELVARHADAITAFTANGWTTNQWVDTYQALFPPAPTTGAGMVALWLRTPHATFATPISPVQVLDLHARFGRETDEALAVLAAGGTERFCVAFLNPRWDPLTHASVEDGWAQAGVLGLTEPQAVGWAATNYLSTVRGAAPPRGVPALGRDALMVLIRTWIIFFGSTAYLHVLAGFTLDEAVTMRDAGTTPTDQQLRVMVALNGHTLPAGV